MSSMASLFYQGRARSRPYPASCCDSLLNPACQHAQVTTFSLADRSSRPLTRAVPFAVLGAVAVDGVNPSMGDSAGGSVVTVAGSGFMEGTRVAFSGVAVGTSFVSASHVLCVSPEHEKGLSPVTVSNNGLDFDGGGADFMFAAPPTVRELIPSRRLLGAGSSTVTVLGTGFEESDSLSCKFGTQRAVPAAWLSSSKVICASSTQHSGQIAVQVSNDGTSFSALSLTLATSHELQLQSLTPSQGFTRGTTLVTVAGRGFAAGSTSLSCTFGSSTFPAQAVSATSILCAISANKAASVQVTSF